MEATKPWGQLTHGIGWGSRGVRTSTRYTSLNDIVDHMFPAVTAKSAVVDVGYNDFNYWRAPVAPLPIEPSSEEVRAGGDRAASGRVSGQAFAR